MSVEEIEKTRTRAIDICFWGVQFYIDQYLKGSANCKAHDHSCDAMVLGSLLKELAAAGLYPIPASPYRGIAFSTLSKSLKSMKLVSLCGSKQEMGLRRSSLAQRPCGIQNLHEYIRRGSETLMRRRLELEHF